MGGQYNRQWPGGRNQFGIIQDDVAQLRQQLDKERRAEQPSLVLYAVTDGSETDWVAAYTPEQAVEISEKDGCHCDRGDGAAPLVANVVSEEEATQHRIQGGDTSAERPLWEEFKRYAVPTVVASTIW